jgi:hypothetical protein
VVNLVRGALPVIKTDMLIPLTPVNRELQRARFNVSRAYRRERDKHKD